MSAEHGAGRENGLSQLVRRRLFATNSAARTVIFALVELSVQLGRDNTSSIGAARGQRHSRIPPNHSAMLICSCNRAGRGRAAAHSVLPKGAPRAATPSERTQVVGRSSATREPRALHEAPTIAACSSEELGESWWPSSTICCRRCRRRGDDAIVPLVAHGSKGTSAPKRRVRKFTRVEQARSSSSFSRRSSSRSPRATRSSRSRTSAASSTGLNRLRHVVDPAECRARGLGRATRRARSGR